MRKSMPIMAVIAISLAACAAAPEKPGPRVPASTEFVTGFDPAVTRRPEACVISVFVEDGSLFVDQEPALSKRCGGAGGKALAWRLDAGGEYKFLKNDDISFKGTGAEKPSSLECKVIAAGKGIRCAFDPPARGSSYPYGVKVHKADGSVLILDPRVFND